MNQEASPYVSRGGHKLAAGLDAAALDVAGLVCADLGCSVGGFTDCLLQRGAARVHAVDTAYGQLAWTLRQDERVVVHERSNALHLEPTEPCDAVVMDLGWTVQARAIPTALRWLKPGGWIVSLVKPHYEASGGAGGGQVRGKGKAKARLTDEEAAAVTAGVLEAMPGLGVAVVASVQSPIRGSKGGNLEYVVVLRGL